MREYEFLYYRREYAKYAYRLLSINQCAKELLYTKVHIAPDVIERAKSIVYKDSRQEEEEKREMIDEAMKSQPVWLFDESSLSVLSGEGDPDVTAKLVKHFIDSIVEDSSGYGSLDFRYPGADCNFAGLHHHEVQWIIERCREEAEYALEKLRDINTSVKYLKKTRMHLNKALMLEWYPVELLNPERPYQGPLMVNQWWLNAAIGDSRLADQVFENLISIGIESSPDEGQPDTLDFFGSHSSNRLTLDYSVDMLGATP